MRLEGPAERDLINPQTDLGRSDFVDSEQLKRFAHVEVGFARRRNPEPGARAFELDSVETETHPVFNLRVPTSCPNVPTEMLNPRNTWEDKAAYDAQADKLVGMFRKNFEDKGFDALGIEPVM